MIDNKLGQQLHGRATRGLPLSEEERAQLDAWYKKLDEEETVILARSAVSFEETMVEMKARSDEAWAEIAVTKRRIKESEQRNKQLWRENELLLEQLRQKMGADLLPTVTGASQSKVVTVVELPIEESLLGEIDQAAYDLAFTREAFIQATLRLAMQENRCLSLELQDRRG